jgi:CDP-diacylglycerol--glycerol-3-phosphate 3-phosphatidyltransferase
MASPLISPNLLTTMRLPLAPLAVYALVTGEIGGIYTAVALALLLEISDIADGFVARKYNIVTDFGKLYDPFSDAFSRYTLFLGFYAYDVVVAPLWMVLAIFYRDSAVSFLRSIAATRHVVIAARTSGKVKAIIQGVGTQVIFLFLILPEFTPLSQDNANEFAGSVMFFITLATVASFFDYFWGNRSLIRGAWNDTPPNT